jgi:predicted ATPase
MPEFTRLTPVLSAEGTWSFTATNKTGLEMPAERLSQGTLVALAIHALAFLPDRPTLLCLEELERGIHPRLLREVHDSLYRLCYPEDGDRTIPPVQVLATTHSPYLLDLFSDHPEEVVLSIKEGSTARFQNLSDLPDLDELMKSASLGDLWYSGVIGGVPY